MGASQLTQHTNKGGTLENINELSRKGIFQNEKVINETNCEFRSSNSNIKYRN